MSYLAIAADVSVHLAGYFVIGAIFAALTELVVGDLEVGVVTAIVILWPLEAVVAVCILWLVVVVVGPMLLADGLIKLIRLMR